MNTNDKILEAYIESLDFDDLPQSYQDECKTDEVDEWDRQLENYVDTLTFDEIPEEFVEKYYLDRLEGGRIIEALVE